MFELQLRKHGQQHNPRWIPTSSSTLAELVSAETVGFRTNAPQPRRENDQPSPATWSNKLGICSLLPETCRLQHSAIFIRRPGMWRTVTVQRRNQRGVRLPAEPPRRGAVRPPGSPHAVDPLDLEQPRSKSRSIVTTLPPASRQMRSPALATAKPRLPRTST